MSKKYIGIDFGTKRVGVAISDDTNTLAFPKEVLRNDKDLINKILSIYKDSQIEAVIMGESRDYKGNMNSIMTETENFKKTLENNHVKVIYEPEILSTVQAQRFQGDSEHLDASSAAVILQSYLDRIKNISQNHTVL